MGPEGVQAAQRKRVALVLRGGGVKGLAFAGALQVLERHYDFSEFVGTSAGAVAAVLLAAGYNADELLDVLDRTDFASFLDRAAVLAPFALLVKGGLYPGNYFRGWLHKQLGLKIKLNRIRMADLKHRAIVFASDAARGTLTFDSRGERDDAEVPFAVRCSMSIPFLFEPQTDGGNRVYDGGMLNNFPIDKLVKHQIDDFVALYLGPEHVAPPKPRSIPAELLGIWLGRDEIATVDEYRDRVVVIDPAPVKTADFRLSEVEKRFLVAEGRAAAMAFVHARELAGAPSREEVDAARQEARALRSAAESVRRKRKWWRWAKGLSVLLIALALTVAGGNLLLRDRTTQPSGRWAIAARTVTRIFSPGPQTKVSFGGLTTDVKLAASDKLLIVANVGNRGGTVSHVRSAKLDLSALGLGEVPLTTLNGEEEEVSPYEQSTLKLFAGEFAFDFKSGDVERKKLASLPEVCRAKMTLTLMVSDENILGQPKTPQPQSVEIAVRVMLDWLWERIKGATPPPVCG